MRTWSPTSTQLPLISYNLWKGPWFTFFIKHAYKNLRLRPRLKSNISPATKKMATSHASKGCVVHSWTNLFLVVMQKVYCQAHVVTHGELYVTVRQSVTVYKKQLTGILSLSSDVMHHEMSSHYHQYFKFAFDIHSCNSEARNVVCYRVLWMPIYVPTGICWELSDTPRVVFIFWHLQYESVILDMPLTTA